MNRDLRKYTHDTNVRLVFGALLLLFVIGLGLIYFLYGVRAAMLGFLCLLAGLTPVLLIVLFLYLMEWITKRAGDE